MIAMNLNKYISLQTLLEIVVCWNNEKEIVDYTRAVILRPSEVIYLMLEVLFERIFYGAFLPA